MFSLTNRVNDNGTHIPKDFADWREIPSEALERSKIREALAKALSLVEEHYRVTFVLRDVDAGDPRSLRSFSGNFRTNRESHP